MSDDLKNWQPRPRPERRVLEGRYVRLEPLDPDRHGDGLYEASTVSDADSRFRWLFEYPPTSRQELQPWLEKSAASEDPLFFAVIDKATGKVAGRQSFMRIDSAFGVIEIGHIYWSPLVARKPGATEAQYLFQKYAFAELGYRRYEWKCDSWNLPSRAAAARLGFTYEGLFRQAIVIRGRNRDTMYFAIIDRDWPRIKAAFERWLDPGNFDANGRQKQSLASLR